MKKLALLLASLLFVGDVHAAMLHRTTHTGSARGAAAFPEAHDETALSQVDPTEEPTAGRYDVYVCHPDVDLAALAANPNVHDDALLLYYTFCSQVFALPSTYWTDLRAVTVEADFWHNGAADIHHRVPSQVNTNVPPDTLAWYVRPSASLGDRLADQVLLQTNTSFGGAYADESQSDVPDEYWTAWLTETELGIVNDDRSAWDVLWDAMHTAFDLQMRAGLVSKIYLANTAGGTSEFYDGITIEEAHVIANGVAVTMESFRLQKEYFLRGGVNYGWYPHNAVWDRSTIPGTIESYQTPGLILYGTIE